MALRERGWTPFFSEEQGSWNWTHPARYGVCVWTFQISEIERIEDVAVNNLHVMDEVVIGYKPRWQYGSLSDTAIGRKLGPWPDSHPQDTAESLVAFLESVG